jgi:hypothetical protein
MNTNQIRIVVAACACFGALVIFHLPGEGMGALFEAVGYSAGTSPIWLPILVLLLFLFRTKKYKAKP